MMINDEIGGSIEMMDIEIEANHIINTMLETRIKQLELVAEMMTQK